MAYRVSQATRRAVRERAGGLCEYCHSSENWQYVSFTIDHVLPPLLGGTDEADNLAYACFHCNRQKGSKITALDPISGDEVSLFNPRQQIWSDHFSWSMDKLRIVGLTAIGNATIDALKLNRERILLIRAADLVVDRHPPVGDQVETNE